MRIRFSPSTRPASPHLYVILLCVSSTSVPLRSSAPAKINLGLQVLGVRDDGFHEIEAVLHPIDWADALTYRESDAFSLTCSDLRLPVDERNLVWKAARALASASGVTMRGEIHLEKNVPYGAGLGSGSSDAAAALLLLREAWNVPCSNRDLMELAAKLGSDVPFFIEGEPAIARGRGEVLESLRDADGSLYHLPFFLVVAVPDVHIPTAEAYEWVNPHPRAGTELADLVRSNDLTQWRGHLRNDFQEPVADRFPAVRNVIRVLERAGAGYVSLSGSGSAVFGVFEGEAVASGAADELKEAGCRVWDNAKAQREDCHCEER